MSDRMLKKCSVLSKYFFNCFVIYFFYLKQDKTVKSTFRLFNLCNGEKNGKNRPTWGKKWKTVFGIWPLAQCFIFFQLWTRIFISVHPYPQAFMFGVARYQTFKSPNKSFSLKWIHLIYMQVWSLVISIDILCSNWSVIQPACFLSHCRLLWLNLGANQFDQTELTFSWLVLMWKCCNSHKMQI